ncbi:hypothetical protein [Nannocystis pusilla]|uniref:hypothetical protein n=1 Tax=Nannocystis pusilla TaxID=889268 RepID=UPI003B7D7BBE
MQAFLDMVRVTDEAMLWIVLMAAPAATLLETCLRLPLYFGQVVEVPAESGRFIENMIRSRHRVSGFGLRFRERRAPRCSACGGPSPAPTCCPTRARSGSPISSACAPATCARPSTTGCSRPASTSRPSTTSSCARCRAAAAPP